MQAVFTLTGPNTYSNGTAPSIGIATSEALGLISVQITDPIPQNPRPYTVPSPNGAVEPTPPPPSFQSGDPQIQCAARITTYFLTKSVARAVASAMMGAAAEL